MIALGVIVLVNVILVFIFGLDFYPAILSMFKDAFFEAAKKDETPIFNLYGVYLFCGRVGTGKTLSMVRRARAVKKRFPKVKIYANFNCKIADGLITCWQDVLEIQNIDENNVNQGVLFLFDEIHLTFDSQSWKSAPANLLEYISLQRHFHKCIFGASQVWSRVNKIIREQSDFIIECKCFFGKRLVRNVVYEQEEYLINGDQKEAGQRKRPHIERYCFFASDKLRSLYDTDEIIGGLSIIDPGVTREEKASMTINEG